MDFFCVYDFVNLCHMKEIIFLAKVFKRFLAYGLEEK